MANAFDGAGNATTFRNSSKTHNADNQLTGPGTYVYDGNGNPTTWSGTSLTFDVENRMTAYGTTLTAGYRGDGLRAWKNTASGQTYFLYDGISVVCELDAGGNVLAGSTYGAAGLLSRGSVQYQFDNLGDATIRLDGSGNVLSYRLFDAWGNEFSSGNEPYGYRARYGYYADGETGLIALAFRYYAPGVGRFLNRDPIGYRGGATLYEYGRTNPVSRTDTTGCISCKGCWEGVEVSEAAALLIAGAAWTLAAVGCVLEEGGPCVYLPPPWNLICVAAVTAACYAQSYTVFLVTLRAEQMAIAVALALCLAVCEC